MSRDDVGDLSAAGSSRSSGTREEFSRGATQPEVQRTLRPFGPTPRLHLHPAKGETFDLDSLVRHISYLSFALLLFSFQVSNDYSLTFMCVFLYPRPGLMSTAGRWSRM